MIDIVSNYIAGKLVPAAQGMTFPNINPHNGKKICSITRSLQEDVLAAVEAAKNAQPAWGDMPGVQRGTVLTQVVQNLQARKDEIAHVAAMETGKSLKDAMAETNGAILLGSFFAGEGQRMYGRTTTSAVHNKYAMTIRQPVGVVGLIIAANTPVANVAWKIFPALVCGNAAVMKAPEEASATASLMCQIMHEAGLPAGLFNLVNGFGREAGVALVEHPDVGVVSFTGSREAGLDVQAKAGARLARVSLELGGKNPLVICDDADVNQAVKWSVLSAFSYAGQRCAAGSRIIVFDSVYETFKAKFIAAAKQLKVGIQDTDDFGPLINQRQLDFILGVVDRAVSRGARVLTGGKRLKDSEHISGFYMAPTIIEGANAQDEISTLELFGPVTCLYRVHDFDEALTMANDSTYGLTASIHTKNFHRAVRFVHQVQAGVAVVNAGTFGSEPHMPFGGVKQSGNGSREPGPEALDVYSNIKDIYMNIYPTDV